MKDIHEADLTPLELNEQEADGHDYDDDDDYDENRKQIAKLL
jgi:hypothetical protein